MARKISFDQKNVCNETVMENFISISLIYKIVIIMEQNIKTLAYNAYKTVINYF